MGPRIIILCIISFMCAIFSPAIYCEITSDLNKNYKIKYDYEKFNVKINNYPKIYDNLYTITYVNNNNTYLLYNSKNNEITCNDEELKKYKLNKEIIIYDNGKRYIEFDENEIDILIERGEKYVDIFKKCIIFFIVIFVSSGIYQYYDETSNAKIKESARKIKNAIKQYNTLKNTKYINSNNENDEV
jgi:hypothetical protein